MDITHTTTVRTTADRLYGAVATAEGIAGWYTPATRAETKLGGIVECAFRDYGTLKFRVDLLTPAREVAWTVVQGPPEWIGSKIGFEIASIPGGSEFAFRHTGLPANYEAHSAFNYLWGQYVRSIKCFAETGTGEPFGSALSIAAGTTPVVSET